ncbi:hypothetical protein BDN72DRAFT_373850 [Pluteus cervinus]|uniref:Uncharacterized protein n=1 Tax=Pluteus cervinus TaxID=181527 RepID=A0ACD3B358_9AGAR|nr:hypothetical protein BDN72DRAFT_373850 [Pluteus cervinus]
MDLFLVPNNPTQTTLISSNGVAHYHIETSRVVDGVSVTRLIRSTLSDTAGACTGRVQVQQGIPIPNVLNNDSEAGPSQPNVLHRRRHRLLTQQQANHDQDSHLTKLSSIVAEIAWKSWDSPTIIRSHPLVLGGLLKEAEVGYDEKSGWGGSRMKRRDKGKGKEKVIGKGTRKGSGGLSDDTASSNSASRIGRGLREGLSQKTSSSKRLASGGAQKRERDWFVPPTPDPQASQARVDYGEMNPGSDVVSIRANKLLYRKSQFSS